MPRKIHLFFALILCFAYAHSQTGTKLDLRLWKHLTQGKINNTNICLLVKGDLNKIKALTEKFGGLYKYGVNDIASVEIPEKNVIAFSSDMVVKKIQHNWAKGVFLMDTARIRNNIDSVQAGYAPLTDSTTGKNVLIGIIDGGINWQHKDFKNADGTTRIMYIWDQSITGANAPQNFNYGNEWSWFDINAGNCTEVDPDNGTCADFSHGTCVAGIAAGNGTSDSANPNLSGVYTGVAPESNLIFVSVGSGNCNGYHGEDFEANVADAVKYIFEKADALGMPCVINTSVGLYYGSHDGKDLATQLIESLLDQRNGRALVAAAGNGGNIPYHLSYGIPSDSTNAAYTFFNYNGNLNPPGAYFDFWADTSQFNNAWFTVGCNDALGGDLGNIGYLNIPQNFSILTDSGVVVNKPLFYGNTLLGSIDIKVSLDEARYHVEFSVETPASTSYLWRLQTYGSGTFDLWASSGLIGSSDVLNSIPGSGVEISDPNYRHPDTLKTIVSEWQCSSKVITVGNYSNRAGYWDYDSNYVNLVVPNYGDLPEVPGKIYATSSLGPTRDNRLKPDIMATGSTILCTGDANDIALKLANSLHYKVALGGHHERNGGTSMASPVVAGIAALYFQKRPTATYNEIKTALICTADQDSFTGATPNYSYGNGKVNAFQALTRTSCITYGATDTSCINYNALANVDTGGCVSKIYGCTDTSAFNYDTSANINNGTCVYTFVANIPGNEISLQVMPNPFSNQTTFNLMNKGYAFAKGQIQIIDQLGEIADVITVTENTGHYTYINQKLQPGIYYYLLKLDGRTVKSGKLNVE